MPKLSDTHLIILTAAAKRDDRAVLPLPKSLTLNKGATVNMLKSLLKKGLIAERPAKADDEIWREDDGERLTLAITEGGLAAIGVESEEDEPETTVAATPAKPRKGGARSSAKSTPAQKPPSSHVRPGTKLALLIDLLNRKQGVTIEEAVEATGWQAHSVRGAISGTIKKKLGLTVTSEPVENRGRAYRIVDAA